MFDEKTGVHQGSALRPLQFAVVMDKETKDIREGVVKELLYADDLALLGDSCKWNLDIRDGREHYGTSLKVNVNKTKTFHPGRKTVGTKGCKYQCSVSGKGVGRISIKSTQCENWVHNKFCMQEISGIVGRESGR